MEMKRQILPLFVVSLLMVIAFSGAIIPFSKASLIYHPPNIRPWACTIDPNPPEQGEDCEVHVTIKNVGTGPTQEVITTWTSMDDLPDPFGSGSFLHEYDETDGLGAGEEDDWYFSFTWPSDNDEHYIYVFTDVDDNVTEYEGDNVQSYGPFKAKVHISH